MIAKDKAEDLFKNYLILFPEFYNDKEYGYNIDLAIKCALIAVDEIIYYLEITLGVDKEDFEYWQEVKEEIEKL